MVIFEKFYRQNLIQIYTKMLQIAPLKKLSGGHAPEPPSNAHGECKFPNL